MTKTPSDEGQMNVIKSAVIATAFFLTAGAVQATTLQASDDAFLRDGSFSNSNNNGAQITVKHPRGLSPGFHRFGILKFDLNGIASLTDATLQLTLAQTQSGTSGLRLYAMDDAAGDGWDETTVTRNNAPAFGAAGLSETTLLQTLNVGAGTAAGTVLSFSNTALVDFLNNGAGADGLVTFGLEATGSGGNTTIQIVSSEGTGTGPQLSVVPVPIPLSGALALSGIGAMVLVKSRSS
ncbi:MAG: DNRLRE domain-containing protein [Pseudomonadota bacterium]